MLFEEYGRRGTEPDDIFEINHGSEYNNYKLLVCGQTIVDALLKGVSNNFILLRQLQKECIEGKISRNLDDQSIFQYIYDMLRCVGRQWTTAVYKQPCIWYLSVIRNGFKSYAV